MLQIIISQGNYLKPHRSAQRPEAGGEEPPPATNPMHLSRYLKIYPDPLGHVILYSTRRAAVLRVPENTLGKIADKTLTEADRETLLRYGILVPDPAKEREEMLTRFSEANRLGKQFRAIVVVNLDCNLACGYCFEEGVRGKNRHVSRRPPISWWR